MQWDRRFLIQEGSTYYCCWVRYVACPEEYRGNTIRLTVIPATFDSGKPALSNLIDDYQTPTRLPSLFLTKDFSWSFLLAWGHQASYWFIIHHNCWQFDWTPRFHPNFETQIPSTFLGSKWGGHDYQWLACGVCQIPDRANEYCEATFTWF